MEQEEMEFKIVAYQPDLPASKGQRPSAAGSKGVKVVKGTGAGKFDLANCDSPVHQMQSAGSLTNTGHSQVRGASAMPSTPTSATQASVEASSSSQVQDGVNVAMAGGNEHGPWMAYPQHVIGHHCEPCKQYRETGHFVSKLSQKSQRLLAKKLCPHCHAAPGAEAAVSAVEVTDAQADQLLQRTDVQGILCHVEVFDTICPGCRKKMTGKRNAMISGHLATWEGRSKSGQYYNHKCLDNYLEGFFLPENQAQVPSGCALPELLEEIGFGPMAGVAAAAKPDLGIAADDIEPMHDIDAPQEMQLGLQSEHDQALGEFHPDNEHLATSHAFSGAAQQAQHSQPQFHLPHHTQQPQFVQQPQHPQQLHLSQQPQYPHQLPQQLHLSQQPQYPQQLPQQLHFSQQPQYPQQLPQQPHLAQQPYYQQQQTQQPQQPHYVPPPQYRPEHFHSHHDHSSHPQSPPPQPQYLGHSQQYHPHLQHHSQHPQMGAPFVDLSQPPPPEGVPFGSQHHPEDLSFGSPTTFPHPQTLLTHPQNPFPHPQRPQPPPPPLHSAQHHLQGLSVPVTNLDEWYYPSEEMPRQRSQEVPFMAGPHAEAAGVGFGHAQARGRGMLTGGRAHPGGRAHSGGRAQWFGPHFVHTEPAFSPASGVLSLGHAPPDAPPPTSPTSAAKDLASATAPATPEIAPPGATAGVEMSPPLSSTGGSVPVLPGAVADIPASPWSDADQEMSPALSPAGPSVPVLLGDGADIRTGSWSDADQEMVQELYADIRFGSSPDSFGQQSAEVVPLLYNTLLENPNEAFTFFWVEADSDPHQDNPFAWELQGSIYGYPKPQYATAAREDPHLFFSKVVSFLRQSNVQGLRGYFQAGCRIYEIDKQGRWSVHELSGDEQLPRVEHAFYAKRVPGKGLKLSVRYTSAGPASCFKLYMHRMGRVISVPVPPTSSAASAPNSGSANTSHQLQQDKSPDPRSAPTYPASSSSTPVKPGSSNSVSEGVQPAGRAKVSSAFPVSPVKLAPNSSGLTSGATGPETQLQVSEGVRPAGHAGSSSGLSLTPFKLASGNSRATPSGTRPATPLQGSEVVHPVGQEAEVSRHWGKWASAVKSASDISGATDPETELQPAGRAGVSRQQGKWAAIWLPDGAPPAMMVQLQAGGWSSTPFCIHHAAEAARSWDEAREAKVASQAQQVPQEQLAVQAQEVGQQAAQPVEQLAAGPHALHQQAQTEQVPQEQLAAQPQQVEQLAVQPLQVEQPAPEAHQAWQDQLAVHPKQQAQATVQPNEVDQQASEAQHAPPQQLAVQSQQQQKEPVPPHEVDQLMQQPTEALHAPPQQLGLEASTDAQAQLGPDQPLGGPHPPSGPQQPLEGPPPMPGGSASTSGPKQPPQAQPAMASSGKPNLSWGSPLRPPTPCRPAAAAEQAPQAQLVLPVSQLSLARDSPDRPSTPTFASIRKVASFDTSSISGSSILGDVGESEDKPLNMDLYLKDDYMHCHILVERLSTEVTHTALFEAFDRCQGCVKASVWSLPSDRSETAGLVTFTSQEAAEAAVKIMYGSKIGHGHVRCTLADPKGGSTTVTPGYTVFVDHISNGVPDNIVKQRFEAFGSIISVQVYKTPLGNCAFVNFVEEKQASNAIELVHRDAAALGRKNLCCKWGHTRDVLPLALHFPGYEGKPERVAASAGTGDAGTRARIEPKWLLKPDSEVASVEQAVQIAGEVVRQHVDEQDLPYCVVRVDRGSGTSALGYGLVGRRIGFIQHGYYEDADTSFQVLQNPEELGRYEPAEHFLKWAVPLATDSHDKHLYSAVCIGNGGEAGKGRFLGIIKQNERQARYPYRGRIHFAPLANAYVLCNPEGGGATGG